MKEYVIIPALIAAGVALSVKTKKLSLPAAIAGGILAFVIFKGSSFAGLLMMAAFFLMGTAATAWKREMKANGETGKADDSQRNIGQVLANALVSALCAFLAILYPLQGEAFLLMLASGFASATSDTLSSELGMVYGRRFYNILSFKRDVKGKDGVISLEGSLLGAIGAAVIAFIFFWHTRLAGQAVIVASAGILGNVCDSVLGASLESKHVIGNNMVNFLNTLSAASFALLLWYLTS